ncbi:hypothetical protein EV368DRAFT_86408 [Lentinula lateritia]|nr:hypothetical protein EV368DRAFT_86408 [Lentinula lateritia]
MHCLRSKRFPAKNKGTLELPGIQDPQFSTNNVNSRLLLTLPPMTLTPLFSDAGDDTEDDIEDDSENEEHLFHVDTAFQGLSPFDSVCSSDAENRYLVQAATLSSVEEPPSKSQSSTSSAGSAGVGPTVSGADMQGEASHHLIVTPPEIPSPPSRPQKQASNFYYLDPGPVKLRQKAKAWTSVFLDKRLPEETQDYLFNAAESIRQNESDLKVQMEHNMAHLDGIVVVMIPLMPTRSREVLEPAMPSLGSSVLCLLPLLISILFVHAALPPIPPEDQMRITLLGTTKERNVNSYAVFMNSASRISQPPWILGFYGNDSYLNEDDKKAFSKILSLSPQDVGDPINGDRGQWSSGVAKLTKNYWKLKGGFRRYSKDNIVMKKLNVPIGNNDMGEVKALKDAVPVILMKKVVGVVMSEAAEFKDATREQKLELLEEAKPLVRKQVVHLAVTKQLLHAEFNIGNFLVGGTQTLIHVSLNQPITDAQLLDFGYPGIFKVRKGVTEKEISDWFELQWEVCTKYGYKKMLEIEMARKRRPSCMNQADHSS